MFEFVPVIIKNALSKPATRNYPTFIRAAYDKQKGHITIDLPSCIYCGMCSRKCPVAAIEVKKQDKSWSIDPFKCIVCNGCVEVCPKKCLYMNSERSPVAEKKSINVFKMPVPEPTEPQTESAPIQQSKPQTPKEEKQGA